MIPLKILPPTPPEEQYGEEALSLAKAHEANGLKALEFCEVAALDAELSEEREAKSRFNRGRFRLSIVVVAVSAVLYAFSWPYAYIVFGFGMSVVMISGDLRRNRIASIMARQRQLRGTYALAYAIRQAIDEATLAASSVETEPPPKFPRGTFSDPSSE